jgi:hypothetical protein
MRFHYDFFVFQLARIFSSVVNLLLVLFGCSGKTSRNIETDQYGKQKL